MEFREDNSFLGPIPRFQACVPAISVVPGQNLSGLAAEHNKIL